MTRYILLLLPLLNFGQSSNAPEVIYPMVEQFVSEAYERKIPVYHKIREIDSIGVNYLPYPFYGLHRTRGNFQEISLHSEFFVARHREKVFLHELGHVFLLPHSDNPRDIMHQGYSNWFNYDANWKLAKEKFYNDLKNTL